MKKSMRMVKVAAALAIVLLFLIIHLADPAFLPHLWGLLSRGDIQETAAYIASFGEWAVLFSFLLTLFVNALGFPPAIIFSTANTLIFGIFWGIFLSVAAETVGVTVSFLLLRFFFRDAAEKIIEKHKTLASIDKYSGKRGFAVMLVARMVPYFPSILLNALGALSAMSMRDYVIASFVGKFPSTGIEAIIGHDTLTHQEDPTRLIVVCIFAVVLIAGAEDQRHRAEELLVVGGIVLGEVGEQCRLHERTLGRHRGPDLSRRSTLLDRLGDLRAPEGIEVLAARIDETRPHFQPVGQHQVQRTQQSVEAGEDVQARLQPVKAGPVQ